MPSPQHHDDAHTKNKQQSEPPMTTAPKRPNAFTELMSASKKPKPTAKKAEDIEPPSTLTKVKNVIKGFDPRNGLGIYLEHPEENPEGRIVDYDEDFVVIKDKFPKASVHLLLIPRQEEYYTQHPLRLLSEDAAFLQDVRMRVDRVKQLAASELRRQFGHLSAKDAPYQRAYEELMSSPDPPTEDQLAALPHGRDWLAEIVAGVHTHPSMSHMHIHVFSRDMFSPCLKHKKHYLSFNSSFLVQMDEFPLEEGSERFHPGDWPSWDMMCWRCGKNFQNKFARLNEHLTEEFERWKRE